MTDFGRVGTEWVPRFGMLEVPRERAELIRGLFELAAFVADHPEVPLPDVRASIFPRGDDFAAEAGEVDRVAAAFGVEAKVRAGGGHYGAVRTFGPVEMLCLAVTREHMAAHQALMSYADAVQPAAGVGAGESR